MDEDDDSYESFCECYNVDDSIDEDTYEEYKYADCEDDFYYNAEKKLFQEIIFGKFKRILYQNN